MNQEKPKNLSEENIQTNHAYAQVAELLKNMGLERNLFPHSRIAGTPEGLAQLLEYFPTQLVAYKHLTESQTRQYKNQTNELLSQIKKMRSHYEGVEKGLQRTISALQHQNRVLQKAAKKGTDIYPQ